MQLCLINDTDIKNSKYTFNLKSFMQVQGPPDEVEREVCGDTEVGYIRLCLFFYFGIPLNWGNNMYECLGMDYFFRRE